MILIGYEIPSGRPVRIPLGHLAITGQTQASGKTTALEALAVRSGLNATAFETKRGEAGFRLLNEQGLSAGEYWWPFSWKSALRGGGGEPTKLELKGLADELRAAKKQMPAGLKLMDLSVYEQATQEAVIAAVLDWTYRSQRNSVTILPEAWQFLPRRRKRSVALAAGENLIRKGAAEGNWLWIDSQDLSSVSYDILRQVQVWVFGVQRQIHEVNRTLDYIPLIGPRPRAAEVATLGVGEFFVAFQESLHKVYAAPAWMHPLHAAAIARGEERIESARTILRELETER